MKNIACFDIGGTFIKYGILDINGSILFKEKFPSPKRDCKKEIPLEIGKKIEELKNDYTIQAIGISTAGKINSNKGEIIFASHNLPGYTGAKLSKDIKELTGLETFIENDVNAAALGEYWKGAGQGIENFVCMTIGTGIGSAIVIDGKLHRGVGEGSGELGHTIINEDGVNCNCGSNGCYERYASTSSLVREYERKANLLSGSITGKDIMNKVKDKEILAVEVYNKFLNHVVTGLVNITHILDLGLIIVGGGISESGDLFFEEINNIFSKKVMPSYSEYTKIVQAKLGNDAGLVGVCYSVLKKLNYIK
ncbi:ROK family protein [Tissierella pigra]|uniref:ROK family protein n=1 Tax=Tissierella pigra TaxID=2607614 RepID=A0A6N7XWF6_9FIRM|nr:ROK family protein [Tissierella pigra]MBU5425562.1 ROK family protein [Tissierella pigra]MSU00884.1 ROK family protein [Tissierella pigra]